MKHLISISIIVFSIVLSCCSHKKKVELLLSHEDSIRIESTRNMKEKIVELDKIREELSGPTIIGDATVSRGVKLASNFLSDTIRIVTQRFEKYKAKLERAQKDSTTIYGALFTRFRLLDSERKYLTATYTDNGHLLQFTSYDDRHISDKDFYFENGQLIYLHERHTFMEDDQDRVTDDSYFIINGMVAYAYRDEGIGAERKDKMSLIIPKRYALTGDLTGFVAKEFILFKSEYDILLSQALEPLLYTK